MFSTELIKLQNDNTLTFGNHIVKEKTKLADFEVAGDIYNVKSHNEITRLEKNGRLLYESIPGTTVHNFSLGEKEIKFDVEGSTDSQITLELEAEQEYKIYINQVQLGKMKTNLSGKVSFSVDLEKGMQQVNIKKV